MNQLWRLDATDQAQLVARREVSALEVLESHLERMDEVNPRLNAVVERDDDLARDAAQSVDRGAVAGPLAGAVATSKINTDHAGWTVDNGIAALRGNKSAGTAACIIGMAGDGAVFAGRTNSPAYAMRFHTGNDLHGETWNPHGQHLSPGGSSGGAAAAVASGMCAVAQGNDVGGSIRQPAFCNGIVGLRPTMGRMTTGASNPNPRAFTGQLMATHGPLTRTMRDLRTVFSSMTRVHNRLDPLWTPVPTEFPADQVPRRVALVTHDGLHLDPCAVDAVRAAGRMLADAGYDVEEVAAPDTDRLFSLWMRLGAHDIVNVLAPMLSSIGDSGLAEVFGNWLPHFPPATAETVMGAFTEREMILRRWNRLLEERPLVVVPALAVRHVRHNEDRESTDSMLRLAETSRWFLNLPALGLPVLAMPMDPLHGDPQGVQIVGRAWREDVLLDAGDAIEARRGAVSVVDPAW